MRRFHAMQLSRVLILICCSCSSTPPRPGLLTVYEATWAGLRPSQEMALDTPNTLAVARINDDLFPDVLVGTHEGIQVFMNDDGRLVDAGEIHLPDFVAEGLGGTSALALADLDLDGHLDAVAISYGGHAVALIGRGNGSFVVRNLGHLAIGSNGVTLNDYDGDQVPDLAIANFTGGIVSILHGTGDGTFVPLGEYDAGQNPFALASADLNRDGLIDLVVAAWGGTTDTSVRVLFGTERGFSKPTGYGTGQANTIEIADLNLDGNLDLAVGGAPFVYFGDLNGQFSAGWPLLDGPRLERISVCPTELDAYPGLVGTRSAGGFQLLHGTAEGFVRVASDASMHDDTVGACADIDGDMRTDTIVISPTVLTR